MASFGLAGSGGGTCAKAPVLVSSATHKAPAIIVKRYMYSSQGIIRRSCRLPFICAPHDPAHIVDAGELSQLARLRLYGSLAVRSQNFGIIMTMKMGLLPTLLPASRTAIRPDIKNDIGETPNDQIHTT